MKLINTFLNYTKPWDIPDVYLFTGNPVIKNNGAIVMGRGAAKQIRDFYPGIDLIFGYEIQNNPNKNIVWVKGANKDTQYLGWFKVKNHWKEAASTDLIAASAAELTTIALRHPGMTFHMNYPGIGNGGLSITVVEPLVVTLPNNVLLYRKDH